MMKHYVQIIKPGIIFGNLIAATGGFLLAARGAVDPILMISTLLGVALVVASGCVFNNFIDRDIDAKMARTRDRVLVQKAMPLAVVIVYAVLLGSLGFALLYFGANAWALAFAIFGYFIYVVVYSLYLKRHSVYGTLIGSLSGAAPPVIGYCAASGRFDGAACLLLIIFSLWQMPHSYAIAIFRFQDYQAANIPVLPIKDGIKVAQRHIVLYIVAFGIAALLLSALGYVGVGYFAVATGLSIYWLAVALSGYFIVDQVLWAKKVFLISVMIIPLLAIMMAIDFTHEMTWSINAISPSLFNSALFN